jgi:hypothetical protein
MALESCPGAREALLFNALVLAIIAFIPGGGALGF